MAKSQGVKDVQTTISDAKKKARELLKKAGRDVRSVRHEVSELKKAGLVSKRLDVRSYQPSRYMLNKIEKNRDVLRGEMVAVHAPKKVREKYTSKGVFEQRGSSLIVPREYKNQKTRITRGLVEISRELPLGSEARLYLPFKTTDMEALAHKLKDDPSLEGMKRPDEQFGFRLFGHNMATFGFASAEELADYILVHYQHLFSGKDGREGVKHFQLVRFKAKDSRMKPGPEDEEIYTARRRKARKPVKDFIIRKRMDRDAARKRKLREKETPAERAKRLDDQRRRQARLRQRNWENE